MKTLDQKIMSLTHYDIASGYLLVAINPRFMVDLSRTCIVYSL